MGDGVSDMLARNECSDAEAEAYILDKIDAGGGVITWWPGGWHHSTVCRLHRKGIVTLCDCSTDQETVFEVRRANDREDSADEAPDDDPQIETEWSRDSE